MDDAADVSDSLFDKRLAEVSQQRRIEALEHAAFRDGFDSGKPTAMQAGFDDGFAQGAESAFVLGQLLGGVRSACALKLVSDDVADELRECQRLAETLLHAVSCHPSGARDASKPSPQNAAVSELSERVSRLLRTTGFQVLLRKA